jgi:aryl-alcohol dehydrogenase-like predicted oxidoreductase
MDAYTNLDGARVSRLGIGCSNFGKRCDQATSDEIVRTALDVGVNFFDVAASYGGGTAESLLARGLRGRRREAIIATKFAHGTTELHDGRYGGAHPQNVVRSAEASLRALETDYIDLFQIHEPDPTVPIAETLGTLETLVEQGKVRWAGCCNFSLQNLKEACAAERGRFRTVQNEYSLLVRDAERDVLPYCRETGMRFIPYFPLASGVLTGKYRMDQRVPPGTRVAQMKPDKLFRFFTPRALDLVEQLVVLGESTDYSVLELALGFHLAEPSILSIITGAMSGEQVRANATAVDVAASMPPEMAGRLRELSC